MPTVSNVRFDLFDNFGWAQELWASATHIVLRDKQLGGI